MAKKMISALKEVVGESIALEERRGKIKSVLMNSTRLELFQFLCEVPGCSVINLSKQFDLSESTIKWHLQRLMEGQYLTEFFIGNRVFYFPKDMIDEKYMKALSTLNEEIPMIIFWELLKKKGMTQKELSESFDVKIQPLRLAIRKLVHQNLILSVIDGRFRRYYPTDELYVLASKNRKKLRKFKTSLIRKLGADLLNPRVQIIKSGERVIEIDIGSIRNHIHIPSDITASVLAYIAKKLEGANKRG